MAGTGRARILVVGDDMRIFLAIVRAYGRAGRQVEAFPYGPSIALKSRYVSRVHEAPGFDTRQAAWKEALKALLARERFDLVVPCSDPAIIFLDSIRGAFPQQRLAIPPAEAMDVLFDKEQTKALARKLGIPVAPAADFTAADTADSLIAGFGLPLVLKPRRTFFADKEQAREIVEIAETREELEGLLKTIEDRSRYFAEGFFVGDGVGVSVLAKDGRILQAFQHRRLREGKGGASSFRISEAVDSALRAASEKICAETKHTGVCMFEYRHNPQSGQWILIETNARFWGSMGLPLAIGLDYPNWLYELMVNGVEHREQSYPVGVRSRNLLLDGLNLVRRLKGMSRSGIAPWLKDAGDFALQPVGWLTGRERSDSFVIDDLKPAFWEFTLVFKKLTGRFGVKPAQATVKNSLKAERNA